MVRTISTIVALRDMMWIIGRQTTRPWQEQGDFYPNCGITF